MFTKLRNSYHNASQRAHHHTIVVATGLFLFAFVFAWQVLMPQGQASANFEGWCSNNQADITIPMDECQALEQLYVDANIQNAWFMQPGSWTTPWFSNTNPCSWYSIGCGFNNEYYINSLNLSSSQLSGTADFRNFSNIAHIYAMGNNLSHIYLSGVDTLESLRIGYPRGMDSQDIVLDVDIYDLAMLSDLFVERAGNLLVNIDRSGFINLNTLGVAYMPFSINNLGQLNGLQSLAVYGNNLANIDLSGLIALEHLFVTDNSLQSIDLSVVPNLRHINLANNQLQLLDLSMLDNLLTISAWQNNLDTIIFPQNSSGFFNAINLANNQLQLLDLSSVRFATGNSNLDVTYNNITDLDLSGQALSDLFIGNNPIQSLNLTDAVYLRNINMQDMGIDVNQMVVAGMDTLSNLQWLYLYNNNLTQFPTFFASVPATNYQVYLDNNYITQFPADPIVFSGLKTLSMANNRLISTTGMAQFPDLTSVNITSNRLVSIADITQIFPAIQSLDVSNNKLETFPLELTMIDAFELIPYQVYSNCLNPAIMDTAVIDYLDMITAGYGFGADRQANQDGCVVYTMSIQIQNNWLADLLYYGDGLWNSMVYFNAGDQISIHINYGAGGYQYHLQGLEQGTLFESHLGPTMAIAIQDGWYEVSIDPADLSYTIVYDPNHNPGGGGDDNNNGDGDNNNGDDKGGVSKTASSDFVYPGGQLSYTIAIPGEDVARNFGQDINPPTIVRDYLPTGLTILTGTVVISGTNFSGYIDENHDLYGMRYGTTGDACYTAFVQDASGPYMEALDDYAVAVSEGGLSNILELIQAYLGYSGSMSQLPSFFMDSYCALEANTQDPVACIEHLYAQVDMLFELPTAAMCGEYGLIQEDFLQYKTDDTVYGTTGDICYDQFLETGTGVYRQIIDLFTLQFIQQLPEFIGGEITSLYEEIQMLSNEYSGEADLSGLEALIQMLVILIESEGAVMQDTEFVQDMISALDDLIQQWELNPEFSNDLFLLEELQGLLMTLTNIDNIETAEDILSQLAGYDPQDPFGPRFAEEFCAQGTPSDSIAGCLDFLFYVAQAGNINIANDYPMCGEQVDSEPYRQMSPLVIPQDTELLFTYSVAIDQDIQTDHILTNTVQLRHFVDYVYEDDISAEVFVFDVPMMREAQLAQAIVVVSQDDINNARSEFDMFIIGEQVRIDDGRGDGGLSGYALLVDVVSIDLGFEQDSYVLVLQDLTLNTSIQSINIIGQDSQVVAIDGSYAVNNLDIADEFRQLQFQGEDEPTVTAFGIIDDKEDDTYTLSTYFGQLAENQLLMRSIDDEDDDSSDIDNIAFILSVQQLIDPEDDQGPTDPTNPVPPISPVNPSKPGDNPPPLQTDEERGICEIRDCSDSYYDQECGICNDEQEHGSADEEEQQQIKSLLIDDMLLFTQTVQQVMAQASCDMSDELVQAYVFAYDVGITTVPDICLADMYGGLIRKHMAKFMVMFATEILGQVPDLTRQCLFDDMDNETLEFRGFARMACQLGIMGVASDGTPVDTFNPDQLVTRAQFGTALSRVLYGSAHNTTTGIRYQGHLNALQQAGIMNMIDDPDMLEVRGYVMLMLMRAYLGL